MSSFVTMTTAYRRLEAIRVEVLVTCRGQRCWRRWSPVLTPVLVATAWFMPPPHLWS